MRTPVPTSLSAAGILGYLQDNRSVAYSIRPVDASATTRSQCTSLAQDIAARGYTTKVPVMIWPEVNRYLSPTEFKARYQTCYKPFMDRKIPVGPCFQLYPHYHQLPTYLQDYWPGDAVVDFLGIDTYPADTSEGLKADPLGTIAPYTSFAKNHGKTFGIAEFGVSPDLDKGDPNDAARWVAAFADLGSSCVFVCYWDGTWLTQTPDVVPAYQKVYDTFS